MKIAQEYTEKEVVQALEQGKTVVIGTDTVYGLLADAQNEDAVERVFQIKGREEGKALPVFVRDIAMAKELAYVSAEQEKFLKENWPGKVTVVLKSKHALPKALESDGKVALRIPDYDLLSLVLKKLNRPITGTSANVSGESSCSSATEVIAQFQKRKYQPDLIIDAGKLGRSKPSRIVDITGKKIKIVRT